MQVVQFQPRSGRRQDAPWSDRTTTGDATIHPIKTQAVAHALLAAANAAGFAPSILDSQPWRWRLTGNTLALYLDRDCIIDDVDADGRLAIISCGAALHHARIALAAEGWRVTVDRVPDPADPDRLASLRLEERSPADPVHAPLLPSVPLRRTDRSPSTGAPITSAQLKIVTAAVRAEETSLHVLYPDEVIELARVAAGGEPGEPGEHAEPGATGGRPAEPGCWDPSADTRPARAADDHGATFALLYGHTDEPEDWLHAGEALSAGWLTATAAGVSVLPLSAAVEVVATRQAVQIMIGCVGYPYLLLRFARATHAPHPSGPRREPTAQVIDRR